MYREKDFLMKSVKLYHISYNCLEPSYKEFIPKIPDNTIRGENESIARICLSDSIEGCLNAAEDHMGIFDKENRGVIMVWEKEFSLEDPKLITWMELYEEGLVPDAAITHEYWYLQNVFMNGSLYEIKNTKDAIANKQLVYIIKPKYKIEVLDVIAKFGVDLNIIKEMDACTILNEWIPRVLPEKYELVIEEIKNALRVIPDEDDISDDLYLSIFGRKSSKQKILDMDPLAIYRNLNLKKI